MFHVFSFHLVNSVVEQGGVTGQVLKNPIYHNAIFAPDTKRKKAALNGL
jgi:hypothetical protein